MLISVKHFETTFCLHHNTQAVNGITSMQIVNSAQISRHITNSKAALLGGRECKDLLRNK
jgi:hypothetical protein